MGRKVFGELILLTVISALYLASLYAIQAVVLVPFLTADGGGTGDFSWKLFAAAVVLNLVLAVVTVACLVTRLRRLRRDVSLQKKLNRLALAMKLLTVPFFVTHLQLWMLVSAAFLVIPGLQLLLFSGLIGVAFAYSVVLVTSSYSICGLYAQYKNGRLSGKKLARDILLQLIFVVDVISYLVFYIRIRRACTGQEQALEHVNGRGI